MLESIRKWNLGIKVILGFVVLTFVLFYAGSFSGLGKNDPNKYAAAVGSEKVGMIEYQNMFELMKQQQMQFYKQQNGEMPPQMYDYMKQQTMNTLVERKLMLLEAHKAGITASDQEVKDEILQSPYFLQNGTFIGMPEYTRVVDAVFHMDVESFERMVSDDIVVRKYGALLTGGILVTDQEVEDQFRKQLTAKIDMVQFDTAQSEVEVQTKPEDVRAYFDSHTKEFETGELRKVRYLWISHESEKNRVQIPEQKLKEYYDQHKEEYSRPEEVHARHILLSTKDKDEQAVKKQAEDLVVELRGGADFAALARQFSEDPGSKENGGDLGFFQRGRMVPEFEHTAFAQEVNQISDPVKTQFGYHIIQTLEKRAGYTMDFALVKEQIQRTIALPQTIDNAKAQAKKVYDEITKDKKKMEDISKIQLVELKTTDFFSKTEDLPGLSPVFRDTVFGLKKDQISEPVQVLQDYAVIQLVDTKASEVPPFEKVQDKVTDKYKKSKAEQLTEQKATAFYDSVSATGDLKAAADKAGLILKNSEEFTNGGEYIGGLGSAPDVAKAAFAMNIGEIGKPTKWSDGYVVFQVKEKKQFDAAEFEKQKDAIRQQLKSQKEGNFLQQYRAMIRKKHEKEIWVNEQMIKPSQEKEA